MRPRSAVEDLLDATLQLRQHRRTAQHAIVKLNEGVPGEGNAMVDLRGLPGPGAADERAAVAERLRAMDFERPDTPFEAYVAKLSQRGGIVAERIGGSELRSPSVQLRVIPGGKVELL